MATVSTKTPMMLTYDVDGVLVGIHAPEASIQWFIDPMAKIGESWRVTAPASLLPTAIKVLSRAARLRETKPADDHLPLINSMEYNELLAVQLQFHEYLPDDGQQRFVQVVNLPFDVVVCRSYFDIVVECCIPALCSQAGVSITSTNADLAETMTVPIVAFLYRLAATDMRLLEQVRSATHDAVRSALLIATDGDEASMRRIEQFCQKASDGFVSQYFGQQLSHIKGSLN